MVKEVWANRSKITEWSISHYTNPHQYPLKQFFEIANNAVRGDTGSSVIYFGMVGWVTYTYVPEAVDVMMLLIAQNTNRW